LRICWISSYRKGGQVNNNSIRTRASWQARLTGAVIRLRIRRRNWGADADAVARRARRVFGALGPWAERCSRGLEVTRLDLLPVPAERVAPAGSRDEAGVVLYLHGGGYVACSPLHHRPIIARLARATARPVVAPDYRLAPETRYPAALHDACASYRWLLDRGIAPTRIAIAGDSAGGGLTLGVLLHARDHGWPAPACAVVFSPWTDMTGALPSVRGNDGRCSMFRPENINQFASAYLGSTPPTDPYASPVLADLAGLPPLLVQVGAEELLLDDSRELVTRVKARGGDATLEIYPSGVFHCWQMLDGIVPEAREALESAARFMRMRMEPAIGL
jgi:acetyl esterase/lipase